MAANQQFDVVGSFNRAASPKFDAQQLMNLYVDDDPQGKGGKSLFSTPGLNSSSNIGIKFIGNNPTRALYVFNDNLYCVVGQKVIVIDSNLVHTTIGTINTPVGYVGIADNGRQLLLVDGTGGWVWTLSTSSFVQITNPAFPNKPTDVSILGARFVVNELDTNVLYFSDENDGTAWNGSDDFAITSQPDKVVGLRRLNDRLFIMGERITEVWYDAGDPVLPFRRSDVLSYGCASASSIAEAFGVLMWLSKTDHGIGSVVLTEGTEPQQVSTQSIEREFQEYEVTTDASAFIYRNEKGHTSYQLSFTDANKSWLFDISEKRWSQLTYNAENRHRAQKHGYFNGKHYVIDYELPILYEMSQRFFTDDGVTIRRLRITPPLYNSKDRKITLNSILFDLDQGIGNDGEAKSGTELYQINGIDGLTLGFDPLLKLRVSLDGGITYGDELDAKMGKLGERNVTTQFFRLGQSRQFVFEIKCDDPVPFVLMGCTVNIDVQQGGY